MAASICPHYIIDSHIHLWPATAANSTSHAWMAPPDMPLAREQLLDDYTAAASRTISLPSSSPEHKIPTQQHDPQRPRLLGAVYIETDRRLLPAPESNPDPITRYHHPLSELHFLDSLVTCSAHSSLLLGLVPWAPIDEGAEGMERFVRLAREAVSGETWERIVGFRFLVQGIRDRTTFETLVRGKKWLDGLRWLGKEGPKWRRKGDGRRGFVFEVGVDQRQGGTWQLEEMAGCIERVRRMEDEDEHKGAGRTVFVLNHFCKPDFSSPSPSSFEEWKQAMARLAATCSSHPSSHSASATIPLSPTIPSTSINSTTTSEPTTYLKLSGFLTELSPLSGSPLTSPQVMENITKYVRTAFELFGPQRVLWGSDWPVCCLGVRAARSGGDPYDNDDNDEHNDSNDNGGRKGGYNNAAWSEWYDIVCRVMDEIELSEEEREGVWWRNCGEAYGLDVGGDGDDDVRGSA